MFEAFAPLGGFSWPEMIEENELVRLISSLCPSDQYFSPHPKCGVLVFLASLHPLPLLVPPPSCHTASPSVHPHIARKRVAHTSHTHHVHITHTSHARASRTYITSTRHTSHTSCAPPPHRRSPAAEAD